MAHFSIDQRSLSDMARNSPQSIILLLLYNDILDDCWIFTIVFFVDLIASKIDSIEIDSKFEEVNKKN